MAEPVLVSPERARGRREMAGIIPDITHCQQINNKYYVKNIVKICTKMPGWGFISHFYIV